MATPVHILGGFLGAGKTTALLHLLRTTPEKLAVVVNDFGVARIDETVLANGTRVASIAGGCVCCTAPEGLAAAIEALLDEVGPDRIVIEPSGLARPQDVLDMLSRGPVARRVAVGATVVLVDPEALPAPGESAVHDEQWEAADVLVINRCDLARPESLAAVRARAAERWPAFRRVVETSFGAVPVGVLDEPAAQGHGHDHDHHHHSTDGYDVASDVLSREVILSWDTLAALLRGDPGIVRFKGLLRTDLGWLRVDLAGGELHASATPWRTDSRWDVVTRGGAASTSRRIAGSVADAHSGEGVELLAADGEARRLTASVLDALPGRVPDVGAVVPGRVGRGVWLRDILALTGAPAEARFVVVASDGLTTSPTAVGGAGEAVLVYALGEGPLPASQGGPFRILAPAGEGRSACANVKGVARIRVMPA